MISIRIASIHSWRFGSSVRTISSSGTVSKSDAAVAAISPQALMRHQSHRMTSSGPIPAPSSRLACQASRIEGIWVMIARAMIRMATFEPRATQTSSVGSGSRPSRRRLRNRL